MAGVVVIAGTPGAGKTTILNGLERYNEYRIVSIGTLMLELGQKEGYFSERDDMRKKSHEPRYYELTKRAFRTIGEMEGKVLVDTHASVEEEGTGRYIPGLPTEALKEIKDLKAFVYVDAHTDRILERRRIDKTRKRREEDAALIDTQRMVNLAALSYYSSLLNIPLYVVFNRQHMVEESMKAMRGHLKEIFG